MKFRLTLEDGKAKVDLYEQQKAVLLKAAQILTDLQPYAVYDTDLITVGGLAEIERLASGKDDE